MVAKTVIFSRSLCTRRVPTFGLFVRYEPSTLVAAFQESHEASLQRLKAWKNWRQLGTVISYSPGSSVADDEPLCAEAAQQTLCSASNSIIFVPTVPAAVSRAALQLAFGSLAGLNEVIPGPVRADLVRSMHHFQPPPSPSSCSSWQKLGTNRSTSGLHSACLGSFSDSRCRCRCRLRLKRTDHAATCRRGQLPAVKQVFGRGAASSGLGS